MINIELKIDTGNLIFRFKLLTIERVPGQKTRQRKESKHPRHKLRVSAAHQFIVALVFYLICPVIHHLVCTAANESYHWRLALSIPLCDNSHTI